MIIKNLSAKYFSISFTLLPLVLVTAMMEIASQKGWIPLFLFPAPSQVFRVLFDERTAFGDAFLQTALASTLGLGLSLILGLSCALVMSQFQWVRKMFYPYAVFFQTVPIIAIAPLLVIWFGYGLPTVVASSFIVSLFPMIANSVLGLLSTDVLLLQLFKALGSNSFQELVQLRIPFAIPQILSGFKISAGLAVIGAIVGEFISGSGLGGVVDTARNQQRIDKVFAAVLLASFLGILFFGLISFLSLILLKHWHPAEMEK